MLSTQKFIIATHFLNYGAAHALRDFLLKKKTARLLFIELPFYDQSYTITTQYVSGKRVTNNKRKRIRLPHIIAYFIDIIEVMIRVLGQRHPYDIFVGVDNLNCLTGIFLRKLHKTKKVIYYSIDFSPIRFNNSIINTIYHAIEKFCVKHADEVWNVSPRIADGREEFLAISKKRYMQKVVPIGVWSNEIARVNNTYNKYQLVFIGHLLEKQGVQEVLRAIPMVRKVIKKFIFVVIGGGEYKQELETLTKKLEIEDSVHFLGWVTEQKEKTKIFSESAIAIAPYKPEKERLHNFTYFADPTKLKEYLASGLPIIMTDVAYNAQDIQSRRCGVIVPYKHRAIAKSIITLMKDKNLGTYKNNSVTYAKTFQWDTIFTSVLS